MALALYDPHLLATYTLPNRPKTDRKGKGVAFGERPHVYASSIDGLEEGEVALAVQGDGIHTFELSEFHPSSSITTKPSTSFASSSVSLTCTKEGKQVRRTYAVLQDSDVSRNGKILQCWTEPINESSTLSREQLETTLPHCAPYLFALHRSSGLVVVDESGAITLLDLDMRTQNSCPPTNPEQKIIRLFLFPQNSCKFAPKATPSTSVILVMFTLRKQQLFLQVAELNESIGSLQEVEIPVSNAKDVIDITCDSSGHASVLGSSGAWIAFQIESRKSSIQVSSSSNSVWLRNLSFIGSAPDKACEKVSLLSLNSSFVLFAGITKSSEVGLLLWDIQYGVLLHYLSLPLPPTLDKTFSVKLAGGTSSQAILVLSPALSQGSPSQLRTNVYVVPFSVPERSTIATAMGKFELGSQFLVSGNDDDSESDEQTEKKRVFGEMRDAIEEGKVEEADKIFFKWIRPKEMSIAAKESEATEKENVDADSQDEVHGNDGYLKVKRKKKPYMKSALDHNSISQVLEIIFRTESPGLRYSSRIPKYFLAKHVVSQSMVQGGVMQAFVQHGDWDSLRECLISIIDIPEIEILRILRLVVDHELSHEASSDKMAVDTPHQSVPTLRSFFPYVVDYAGSASAWRSALHVHFTDVVSLSPLMSVIEDWLKVFASKDLSFELGDVIVNDNGIPGPQVEKSKSISRVKGMLLPPLEKILAFLQAILDSSFVKLVQEPAGLARVQRLSDLISPHVSVNTELEQLRGPLAAFAKAQVRALTDAKDGKKKDNVDWRKRRKQEQEQAALTLGPYQVEELVF